MGCAWPKDLDGSDDLDSSECSNGYEGSKINALMLKVDNAFDLDEELEVPDWGPEGLPGLEVVLGMMGYVRPCCCIFEPWVEEDESEIDEEDVSEVNEEDEYEVDVVVAGSNYNSGLDEGFESDRWSVEANVGSDKDFDLDEQLGADNAFEVGGRELIHLSWAIATLECFEVSSSFPHLPSMWKSSWVDSKVRLDVLPAVLTQQHQGDWLCQVTLKLLNEA
ncbi:hypothetical protein GBA52_016691 [Prunus armeniaca]|nr:hypothetical protein GBA52_016691 [Prunus armeniaca]